MALFCNLRRWGRPSPQPSLLTWSSTPKVRAPAAACSLACGDFWKPVWLLLTGWHNCLPATGLCGEVCTKLDEAKQHDMLFLLTIWSKFNCSTLPVLLQGCGPRFALSERGQATRRAVPADQFVETFSPTRLTNRLQGCAVKSVQNGTRPSSTMCSSC